MSERRKDCGCSKVTFSILPQNVSKMEENRKKTAQNEPKLRESCAPWQKLRACTKTPKLHKSCAAQHRNFLGGLSYVYSLQFLLISTHHWYERKCEWVFFSEQSVGHFRLFCIDIILFEKLNLHRPHCIVVAEKYWFCDLVTESWMPQMMTIPINAKLCRSWIQERVKILLSIKKW